MSRNTKQATIASDTSLKNGIDTKYAGATWLVQGQPYTTPQVGAVLDKRIAANEDCDQKHADWRSACATSTTLMQQSAPLVHAVEQRIRAECGNDPAALAVFGLKPTRKGKRTAQEKAQAAEKAVATRKRNDGAPPATPPKQ